jgi:hypothetical protein
MPGQVGKVQRFYFALDVLDTVDVRIGGDADEPAGEERLDQHFHLVDVAHEGLVDPSDARAPIGREDDEAFAPKLLQRFTDRVGAGAVMRGERRNLEAFVGCQPAFEDVSPDQLVNTAHLRR